MAITIENSFVLLVAEDVTIYGIYKPKYVCLASFVENSRK